MRASLRTIAAFALLGTAINRPALAQPAVPIPPTAATPAAPPVVYPPCPNKPTERESQAAHGAFQAGMAAFEEADYPKALSYFNDAYKRDCTKHSLLVIIARTYEAKGDRPEAIRALRTFLDRAPRDTTENIAETETQRKHLANLEAQVAAQQPEPAPPAAAPVPPSPTPPPPSNHDAEPERHHTVPPWIVVGVGAAAVVTGVVIQVVGLGKVSDAAQHCPDHVHCPPANEDPTVDYAKVRDAGNAGRTLSTVGAVTWAVGLGIVGGGLAWHFLERPSAKDKSSLVPRFSAVLTPPVFGSREGLGFAGLQAGGRF